MSSKFGWDDADITFYDDDGKPLTHDQVRAMQAEAEAEEQRVAEMAEMLKADRREQAEARKKR